MKCPMCEDGQSRIVDSRKIGGGYTVRRRRMCRSCGYRHTTHEISLLDIGRMKKDDGTIESMFYRM